MDRIKSPEFLKSILQSVPVGIVALDEEGAIALCNDMALRHLDIDRPAATLPGTDLATVCPDLPQLTGRLRGLSAPFELAKLPFHNRYLTITGRPIRQGLLLTTVDLTPEVEREMNAVNAMVEAQEMERRRLSKEIHDGIGPLLSTLKLSLEGMKAQVGNRNLPFTRNYHNALDLLDTVTREVRSISHDLMPGALVDFGLVAALENLCRKAGQSGQVRVNFYHAGIEDRLEQNVELGLYRIAQELLSNVFKHAHAQTANVQLIRHSDCIILMVEDDGVGFDRRDLRQVAASGIGLQNIRTRALSLGGSFTLESQPGKGVLATVEIPNS